MLLCVNYYCGFPTFFIMKIILASSSPYRSALLAKLSLPFTCQSPDIDESPLAKEKVEEQVARLATLKAAAIAFSTQDAYIIGSDQLAMCNQEVLGKPGGFQQAVMQLTKLSGQKVTFYTGLCLFNAATKEQQTIVETFEVTFKPLSDKQIQHYLMIEQPFDCAGSFKSEGLGIALFDKLEGRDPNTLVGLPLIALVELFTNWGIDIFDFMQVDEKSPS
jgi:septum formation protein